MTRLQRDKNKQQLNFKGSKRHLTLFCQIQSTFFTHFCWLIVTCGRQHCAQAGSSENSEHWLRPKLFISPHNSSNIYIDELGGEMKSLGQSQSIGCKKIVKIMLKGKFCHVFISLIVFSIWWLPFLWWIRLCETVNKSCWPGMILDNYHPNNYLGHYPAKQAHGEIAFT